MFRWNPEVEAVRRAALQVLRAMKRRPERFSSQHRAVVLFADHFEIDPKITARIFNQLLDRPEFKEPEPVAAGWAIKEDLSQKRGYQREAAKALGRLYGPVWYGLDETVRDERKRSVIWEWQAQVTEPLRKMAALNRFRAEVGSFAAAVYREHIDDDREAAGKMRAEDIEELKEQQKRPQGKKPPPILTMDRFLDNLEASSSEGEHFRALLFRLHRGEKIPGLVKQPSRTLGKKKRAYKDKKGRFEPARYEPETSLAYQDLTGEKYNLRRGSESLKGRLILVTKNETRYHGPGASRKPCPTCSAIARYMGVPGLDVKGVVDSVLAEWSAAVL